MEGDREKDETGNCETSNTGKRPRSCSDDEEDVQEEDGEDNTFIGNDAVQSDMSDMRKIANDSAHGW